MMGKKTDFSSIPIKEIDLLNKSNDEESKMFHFNFNKMNLLRYIKQIIKKIKYML